MEPPASSPLTTGESYESRAETVHFIFKETVALLGISLHKAAKQVGLPPSSLYCMVSERKGVGDGGAGDVDADVDVGCSWWE